MATTKTKCNSYFGTTCRSYKYTCPGYRTQRSAVYFNRVMPLDLIEARNVNELKSLLKSEIENRLQNPTYTSSKNGVENRIKACRNDILSVQDAVVGETAEAGLSGEMCQLNKIDSILNNLAGICKTIDNKNKQKTQESKYISNVVYLDHEIKRDDLMEAESLSVVADAIGNAMKDCICYSDCASYYACSCYGNCGCNY